MPTDAEWPVGSWMPTDAEWPGSFYGAYGRGFGGSFKYAQVPAAFRAANCALRQSLIIFFLCFSSSEIHQSNQQSMGK